MEPSSAGRPTVANAAAKARPRSEWIMRVWQPPATAGVRVLARLGVDPQGVVWSHAAIGAVAAAAIAVGGTSAWWSAAVLLQVKSLLDSMDGGLARATGRVTQMGRYLDTVLDTFVNAALFAALALHGPAGWSWPLAAGALLLLTVMLSLDFNLERRYRELRGALAANDDAPAGASAARLRLFRGVYDALLGPQDRLIERLDRAAFARLRRAPFDTAELVDRLAWNDLWSTATLVNLGLSTQMLVLGLCLAFGQPFTYVVAVYAMAAFVVALQALRAVRFRRYLGGQAA